VQLFLLSLQVPRQAASRPLRAVVEGLSLSAVCDCAQGGKSYYRGLVLTKVVYLPLLSLGFLLDLSVGDPFFIFYVVLILLLTIIKYFVFLYAHLWPFLDNNVPVCPFCGLFNS